MLGAALFSGAIQIAAIGGLSKNPRWADFLNRRWPNMSVANFNREIGGKWRLRDDFFHSFDPNSNYEARDVGTFAYDAVAAFGLALCDVSPHGPMPLSLAQDMWERMTSPDFSFNGLTGHVR